MMSSNMFNYERDLLVDKMEGLQDEFGDPWAVGDINELRYMASKLIIYLAQERAEAMLEACSLQDEIADLRQQLSDAKAFSVGWKASAKLWRGLAYAWYGGFSLEPLYRWAREIDTRLEELV